MAYAWYHTKLPHSRCSRAHTDSFMCGIFRHPTYDQHPL